MVCPKCEKASQILALEHGLAADNIMQKLAKQGLATT